MNHCVYEGLKSTRTYKMKVIETFSHGLDLLKKSFYVQRKIKVSEIKIKKRRLSLLK